MTLRPPADIANESPRSYAAHIASGAWADRKAQFFRAHPRRCVGCDATRELHVHHKTYERFGAERDTDLVCLCATCHSIVHQHHRAIGGSLAAATDAIIELLRRAAASQRSQRSTKTTRKPVGTVLDRWGRTVERPTWLVVSTT